MRRKRKKTGVKRRTLRKIITFLGVFWWITGWLSSLYLTRTQPKFIPKIPRLVGNEITYLQLITTDSIIVNASLIQGKSKEKCVIILPGIKGNRINCYSHAKLYLKAGYSVLLPDLRGTGESKGDIISFGWNEQKDLIACVKFLHQQGFRQIGAHGISLGAATIVYSLNDLPKYDFLVLESCYDNIKHAFYNRLEKLDLPIKMYYSVEKITGWRIGVPLDSLNPEKQIVNADCPVLYFAGDTEEVIKNYETQAIFDAISSSQKKLHIFKKGKHQDFLKSRRYKNEYRKTWKEFIKGLQK